MVGASPTTSDEIDAVAQDKALRDLSKSDLRAIFRKVEDRIRQGRIHELKTPSEAGGSGVIDFQGPDAATTVGTLYTVAGKLAADLYTCQRNAPESLVGENAAHAKFACSSVASANNRVGSPYWEHLTNTYSGKSTVISARLECLLCKVPDTSTTDRLDEFVLGPVSKKSYCVAMKDNGATLRINARYAPRVIEVKNLVTEILQGYFTDFFQQ